MDRFYRLMCDATLTVAQAKAEPLMQYDAFQRALPGPGMTRGEKATLIAFAKWKCRGLPVSRSAESGRRQRFKFDGPAPKLDD